MKINLSKKLVRCLVTPASRVTAMFRRLRVSAQKMAPVGYEDETGFHVTSRDPIHR